MRLAESAYGHMWQSALARDMDLNVRTVQRWAVDGIPKDATADRVRAFIGERRRQAGPLDTVGPRVEAIVEAYVAAGHDRAAVLREVARFLGVDIAVV